MHHNTADGVAASRRAQSSYQPAWHPILAAREVSAGHWFLIDGLEKPYGEVAIIRRGTEVGYRADRCDERGAFLLRVGYFTTLRAATWAIHGHFLKSHGSPSSREYGR